MLVYSLYMFDHPVPRMWYGKVEEPLCLMMDTTHILVNYGCILHLWLLALGGYVSHVPLWFHCYFSLVVSMLHPAVGASSNSLLLLLVLYFPCSFNMARESSSH